MEGLLKATGATLESSATFPKVLFDPLVRLVGAYKDEFHSLSIVNLTSGPDVPAIRFWDSSSGRASYIYYDTDIPELTILTTSGDIQISASSGALKLWGTPVLINGVDVQLSLSGLQSQINNLNARVTALENA
jgi:hypothetical protein